MPGFSIRTKMVFLVLVVLIPLILLEITRINTDFNEKINIELSAGEEFAKSITSSLNGLAEELWIREAAIGNLFINSDHKDPENIQKYLNDMGSSQYPITGLSWISPEGTVIASQDAELIGDSIIHSEYFREISSGEEKVITNMISSNSDPELTVIIARCIKSNGVIWGIIAGKVDPQMFMNRFSDTDKTHKRSFSIFDNYGNVIFRSGHSNFHDYTAAEYIAAVGAPTSAGTISMVDGKIPKGTQGANIKYPVGLNDWVCLVSTNLNTVKEKYNVRLSYDLTILAFVSVFSVLFALVLAKKTLGPLINIKEAISAVKKGDYSVRTNIYGKDELATTAQAIDNMVHSIYTHDKMKSQFFTDLSHELKTPLNVIFASIQLIESIGPADCICDSHSRMQKQIKSIRQNCYRLMRIISNLLDVSKFDSGYLTANMGNHNIISIIEDVTMSVVNFAENKGVSIIFDTDTEEKHMACDPYMIERIMLNLLSNALKFTDRGGKIYVEISSHMDRVIITVKDTGIGIPYDKLNQIFDRFKQVDSSLSRNQYGSGIGLTLTKSLVESHNGTIYVSSIPDKGTKFTIHLPVSLLPDIQKAPLNEKQGSANNHRSLIERINIEFSDIYDNK